MRGPPPALPSPSRCQPWRLGSKLGISSAALAGMATLAAAWWARAAAMLAAAARVRTAAALARAAARLAVALVRTAVTMAQVAPAVMLRPLAPTVAERGQIPGTVANVQIAKWNPLEWAWVMAKPRQKLVAPCPKGARPPAFLDFDWETWEVSPRRRATPGMMVGFPEQEVLHALDHIIHCAMRCTIAAPSLRCETGASTRVCIG